MTTVNWRAFHWPAIRLAMLMRHTRVFDFRKQKQNKQTKQEQTIPGIRNSDTGRSIADRNRKRLPDSPGAGISIGWTGTGSSTGRDSGAGRPFDSIRRRNPIRRKNSGKAVWSKSRRRRGTGS